MNVNEYLTGLTVKNIIRARESEEAFQKALANLKHQYEYKITRDIVISTLNDDSLACDTTFRLKHLLGLGESPLRGANTEQATSPAIGSVYWYATSKRKQAPFDDIFSNIADSTEPESLEFSESTTTTSEPRYPTIEDLFASLVDPTTVISTNDQAPTPANPEQTHATLEDIFSSLLASMLDNEQNQLTID